MDASSQDPVISTFDAVTGKLREIGAVSVEEYLSSTLRRRVPAASLVRPASSAGGGYRGIGHVLGSLEDENDTREPSPLAVSPLSERNLNEGSKPNFPLARDNAISRLHQACIHTFGSSDPLNYEFVEENGQKSKQCILTITISEGHSRSYKSEAVFLRRADAKARVATIAIQMGALDFISQGSLNTSAGDQQLPVSPVGVVGAPNTEQPLDLDPASPECLIEKCLVEWRAGKISAEWVFYNDPRVVGQYGAALRIRLTDHSFRVYSCDSIYKSEVEAKTACAQKAFDEGVIDYIKFGNGQKEPTQPLIEDLEPELFDQQRPSPKPKTRPVTLQAFYESLPQPFPESFGTKTAAEINAPTFINTLLQSARGGRLKYNFYWVTDKTTNLLGCLLRLERADVTKTYLVDCLFQKRSDAKSAACLLGLSQGLGDYIRSVKTSMDANFTPEMRKLASEKLIFALNTECSKVRQGNRLNFSYSDDVDAFGASLEIDISSSPTTPDIRKWSVPAEYRSKNDAKLAVCYHAISQGAIEVLQFRGATPPPDHVSYWDVVHGRGTNCRAVKRKSAETEVVGETRNQPKKRKKDAQKVESKVSVPRTGGGTTPASQSGTPVTPKRSNEKRPLNTRLQELNGCLSSSPNSGGRPPPTNANGGMPSPGEYATLRTPYYPPPPLPPGPHYSYHHPHMGTPPTGTSSPMYYPSSATVSPIAFTTYHPHSTIPMPEQMIPGHHPHHPHVHPPMYQPPYMSPYPQHPPPPPPPGAVSPYYTMPSPYHSPYGYGNSPPLYLPSTPDYHLYNHHPLPSFVPTQQPPQALFHPQHSMSPPSTPPRPKRIKRVERGYGVYGALSPLGVAENLAELEEVGVGHGVNVGRDGDVDRKGEVLGKGEEVHVKREIEEEVHVKKEREKGSLEPGELTEGEGGESEGAEEEEKRNHQVLERRASMP